MTACGSASSRRSTTAVSHAVAAALRLQQQQGLGIEASVIEYLRTRELLLVVDNCEHVLDAAAKLVDQIVRHCPKVVMLATSREALGVAGEQILPISPLPVEDATQLFADRAKAGRPDFDLDNEPVGAVAEICRRLDGLPLAIELAAARMRAMSSLDVARRLDRLRLLSGGARDALPRQQSLAATIDWSYQLLTEAEQALFMRLSVFAGGFDLDAAHGVCGADGDIEDDTLELLTGLVDKSMVTLRSGTDMARYGVLETLRAYGRDRLRENGIDGDCTLHGMRSTTRNSPNARPSVCTVQTSARGSNGCCPITTTCAPRSSMSWRTRTSTPCFGWSRRCPNSSICESDTSRPAGRSGR